MGRGKTRKRLEKEKRKERIISYHSNNSGTSFSRVDES
jgi:hypothetical protein